ncbi:hypothetical protein V4V35_05375 [Bacillus infantis]|uniref:hypothetical protein n=1 Tax=Bacillus infantis TaxID=324767 RepID=UPI002FBE0116
MHKTALLTVTHDPTGNNCESFIEYKSLLEDIYEDLFIAVSNETSPDLIKLLEESQFKVKIIPKRGAAHARRKAVEWGLTSQMDYYHYCDFDRILTWSRYYPEELGTIISNISAHDYTIIGRTERAFKTHPVEWVETEKITNRICSLELGKQVDITAGSCAFSRQAAGYINQYSEAKMTDAEWAMIIHRIAQFNLGYIAAEGLEYHEEINGVSKNISQTEKWIQRLELSLIISKSARDTVAGACVNQTFD